MIWTLIGIACRLIGLAEWFSSWNGARVARKQAQYEADAPKTLSELENAQRKDDF
jgi:hypothetical protein